MTTTTLIITMVAMAIITIALTVGIAYIDYRLGQKQGLTKYEASSNAWNDTKYFAILITLLQVLAIAIYIIL